MKKILITGGHVTPALAVIAELKHSAWEIVYVGRMHALEGDESESVEYQLISAAGVKFIPITTGRLQRRITLNGLVSLFKIPVGFLTALAILSREKPDLLLSFGGYVALPMAIAAGIFNIPIITHEQTRAPGLTNRIIARLARFVCLGWPDLNHTIPAAKIVITGNPVRPAVFNVQKKLDAVCDKPVLYITGGSLGSHSINELFMGILPELTRDFTVIHQCGRSEFNDLQKLARIRELLPIAQKKRYLPLEFINDEHIGWVYKTADILVSRAGANTLTEIIALQKPTLFIPLPWSGANEQEKNAQFLVERGAALSVQQTVVTEQKLLLLIQQLFRERTIFEKQLKDLASYIIRDSAQRIVAVIESVR